MNDSRHMVHKDSVEDNSKYKDAASEGKDQRQGKQYLVFESEESTIPAGSKKASRDEAGQINTESVTDVSDEDVETLREEELSGPTEDTLESANYSDTDEDEDEGLGDGNLGRTVRGGVEG